MSSSPTSSSNTEAPAPQAPAAEVPFNGLLDTVLPVDVLLGTGSITVRRCLKIRRNHIVRLDQSAGEDLQVVSKGVTIARGEVLIVEDSSAVRVTDISLNIEADR
jgi:flagellar motor switch protein FliN/FliY